MAETSSEVPAVATVVDGKKSKKAGATVAKKPKAKATHPPTADMVNNAIRSLKERGGSSLLAIKKYLAANYKVDADKLAPFIKKYLKSAVISGKLIQTKGKGASGSFKLSTSVKTQKDAEKKNKAAPKKSTEKKITKVKPVKVAATKKEIATATKKPVAGKKKAAASVAKNAKTTGSVKVKTPKQKSTKPSKTGAKKAVKAPKPKKVSPAPKKAVSPKKPTKK